MGKSLRAKCKLRVRALRRERAAPQAAEALAKKVAVAAAAAGEGKVPVFNADPTVAGRGAMDTEDTARRGRSRAKKFGGVDKQTGLKTVRGGWYSLYPNGEPQAGAGAAGAGQGGAADGAAAEEGGQGGVEAMETDGAAAKKKKSKAKAAGKEAKPRPFNELTKVSKRLPFHTRKKLKRKQTAKLR